VGVHVAPRSTSQGLILDGPLPTPRTFAIRRLLGDEDLTGGGSDRLVDAIVCWGDLDAVAGRVRQYHEAGADHVCVQVLSTRESFPLEEYRELAPTLLAL
jgi:hypothetical protein